MSFTAILRTCEICEAKIHLTIFVLIDPIRPAQPQWFSAKKITATSIQFQWAAPFHNGGGTLHGYVLTYLEPIVEVGDEQTTGRGGKIVSDASCIEKC